MSDSNRLQNDKVIPVNSTGGVPIEMVPYHKSELSSVNESLPVLRLLDVLIPPERECGLPVFFLYAVIPVSSFLRMRRSVKSMVLRNLGNHRELT